MELARPKHWREIYDILGDDGNYDYEISRPLTKLETKLSRKGTSFPSGFAKSNILRYRVTTLDGHQTVGTVSASFSQPYYVAQIGFMMHFDHQGKGYGCEAVAAVCDFLLNGLKVERITAMCDAKNASCRALLEKVGFALEGMRGKFFHHPDRGWLDSPLYALLRNASS